MSLPLHPHKILSHKRSVVMMIRRITAACFMISLLLALGAPAYAQEAAELYELSPQEGELGSEVFLRLDGEGFDNLGELREVSIDGIVIPVINDAIVSNQLIEMTIEITENVPVGVREISFFYENGGFDATFTVLEPGRSATTILYGVSPQEGRLGTEMTLMLDGDGFFELGELIGVQINGLEVPLFSYDILANDTIEAFIGISEDVPTGEGEISFFFENNILDAYFVVLQSEPVGPPQEEQPRLHGVRPQEAEVGSEVFLVLNGDGFFELGDLEGVAVNGVEVPFSDYTIVSNQEIEINVAIHGNVPIGEGGISFFFARYSLDAPFVVLEPGLSGPDQEDQPHLHGIYPEEGEVGSEVYLTLEGDGFDQLDDLDWVEISGVEIPLLDYDFISDQVIEVLVEIPEDAQIGDGEISFIFENDRFENFFFVSEAQAPPVTIPPEEPPYWIILLVFVVGGGGLIAWRIFRPRPPKPTPPPANIHFKVKTDPGVQSLEFPGDSLKPNIDIRLITKVDPGDQQVEEEESITG